MLPSLLLVILGSHIQESALFQQGADRESTAPTAPTEEAAPAPQPIAEGEILARADVVTATLRRIEALIQPEPEIERIDGALSDSEVTIETLRGELDELRPIQISTWRLENRRLPWLELEKELASWKSKTDARFTALQADRDRLRAVRSQWELTLATAEELDLAPDLEARAERVLARVLEVEARVRERRNSVGTVAERIGASQERVSEALEQIDAFILTGRERWTSRDAAPLWRAWAGPATRSVADRPAEALSDWVKGLVDYFQLLPERVTFLAASFFVLLLTAFHLRRRTRELVAGGEAVDRVHAMLERPFAVALASALVMTLIVVPYPTGSSADVLLALTLVAVVRLGAVVLEGRERRTLYGIVLLTLMARVAALAPGGSLGGRLLLLAVTVLALIEVLSLTRVAPTGRSSSWERTTRTLAILATLTLTVALGANVFGWQQLSKVLTEATIISLFSAIGWLVLVEVMEALLPVAIDGPLGGWLSSLRRNQPAVTRVTTRAVVIVAVVLWLRGALIRFQLHGAVVELLQDIGQSELSVGGLTIATGALLGAALVLVVIWLIAQLVGFFLREQVVPSLRLRRGSGESLITVSNYFVWGVGIAMAASSAGLSGTQLAVVIGALGVGIGFGLQTIVNNFVSGLILIFERPIKVGDTLQMPEYWGRVERIGIRASVIRSFDGAEIIVPNGELISRQVVNWTGTDEHRRGEILVGVAYGTEPERVIEVLRRVAQEHPLVLKHPEVKAQMVRFGESALEFRLRFWTRMDDWIDLMSDLHVAINRELRTAGITIPFPQRDLHIRPAPSAAPLEPPEAPGAG